MRKLSSHLGQFTSEVKAFVADRWSASHARAVAGHAIDLIFPPHGLDRHASPLSDFTAPPDALMGSGMSVDRWSAIRFLDIGEGCEMCARPFEHGLHFGLGALCRTCEAKPFPFARTRAACLYNDASKDMILSFKHADRLDLVPVLSRWLERAGADVLHDCDVVVPVPLHPLRLFERRYNQAAELARPVAQRLKRDYLGDGLQRTKRTKSQGHASADQRWANVRGAFAVTQAGAKRVRGRHVVLIDDVFTTGSTLKACAQALRDAGARQVDVCVLARVVAPSS